MTLDPYLRRHWHNRLDNLDACAEHAPKGLYVTAIAVRTLIGDTAEQLISDVCDLGLCADNSDAIRDVEAALYRYIVQSNPETLVFISAEGFGEHASNPASTVHLIPVQAPATNPDRAQVAAIGARPGDTPSQSIQRLRVPATLTLDDITRLAALAADHQRLSDAMVDHGKGRTAIRLLLNRGYVNITDQTAYDVLTVVDSRVCAEARRMGVELRTNAVNPAKEP